MTIEICKEYLKLCEGMNGCDPDDDEDKWNHLSDLFHHHLDTCLKCDERAFYSEGCWQWSTDEGTKCKRCLSPPGYFCKKGCEDYYEKEIAEAKINS